MKISIIIPVFNEEKSLNQLYHQLKDVLAKFEFDHEIIFVNDGSKDDSSKIINQFAESDDSVKLIEFTKNFGKEMAISAGLHNSQGDAAIMLDADLQHPAALIPDFIKKWQAGSLLVVGVRNKNKKLGFLKNISSWFFYRIINAISEVKIIPRSTDFRLLDRKVIDEFNRLSERNRMVRGLISWLGFEEDYIHFDSPLRGQDKAGYTTLKLIKLALSSMISLSLFPLKIAGYLGIFITFFSGLGGLFILIEKYILKDPWQLSFSGPAILAVIILFLVGIILSCLGLIALYIASIHGEVVGRPIYVIKNKKL